VSNLLSAPDEYAAMEQLHATRCTDGLPVVVPTVERVERMVLATGLDADLVLGKMGPQWGAATVHKVAVSAVMAGCLPDYVPVVIAAIKAVCEPQFDLAEMQGTTHCTAPLLIVNGPARAACGGISGGFGALGPGHRANASIGRALRLAMINIGGALPGESDMSLLGHPGKFSYCLAEDEENSPFAPMHTSVGFNAEQSVVTVVGAEAPHSVIFSGDADDPKSPERLINALARAIASPSANNSYLGGKAAVTVILNPDHAGIIARAGYDRSSLQEQLAARAVTPREVLEALNPKMIRGEEAFIPAVRDAANILVLTAGGSGLYSMVMPSWAAGPHANQAVHMAIDIDAFCEIPGAV
jgi:hypothetical protein